MSSNSAIPWRYDPTFRGTDLAHIAHVTRGDHRFELSVYATQSSAGFEIFGPPSLSTLLATGEATTFLLAKRKCEQILEQLTVSSSCGGPVPVDPRDC